jgi:hypothetical protein
MSLQRYRNTRFKPESLERIERVNEILSEYDQKLTARQVYYQFVARGWLDNNQRNYKTLTNLLTDARYNGMVDWDAIEDRGREPDMPSQWNNIGDVVESALRAYRLPRWRGQENYVELWVEKQALAGVLAPIARRFHVTLMVNKGYSSASAMKESADRMIAAGDEGQPTILFYLGDHDPSGEDMVRDIRDRLIEFGAAVDVRKLALTMAQIRRWNPPPNPAKLTDSRAAAYIARHGDQSWELDALPPRELNRLIEVAFREVVDASLMQAIVDQEEADKRRLREATRRIMENNK